jgi:hypothetical protein
MVVISGRKSSISKEKSVLNNEPSQDPASLTLVSVFNSIAGTYCVSAAIAFYIYRYWQYSWMLMAYANPGLRDQAFGQTTWTNDGFESRWNLIKQIMSWSSLLLLLSGLYFGQMTYYLWFSANNRFGLTRVTLQFKLACLAITSLMMMYFCNICYGYIDLIVMPTSISRKCIDFIFILSCIGAGLAAINMVAAMKRWRFLLFLTGMILMLVVLLSISANGLLWRNMRKYQTDKNLGTTCNQVQRDISFKNLEAGGNDRWCVDKYFPSPQSCRKIDLTYRWEDTGVTTS